jgi:hypothetical protein
MNNYLMSMKKLTEGVLLLAVLLMLGISSCTWNTNPAEEINLPDSAISFSDAIIPIFETSCLGPGFCHGDGNKSPILTEASAYNSLINGGFVDVDNPDQSELYQKIDQGGSMAGYTNAQDRALILQWIIEGAENN